MPRRPAETLKKQNKTTPYDILSHVHSCNFIAQGEVYPDFRHLSYQARAS